MADATDDPSNTRLRRALNAVQELLVLSMLLFDHHLVDDVLRVFGHSVGSVTRCQLVQVTFVRQHEWTSWPGPHVAAWETTPSARLLLEQEGDSWTCTTPIAGLSGPPGSLVLRSAGRPDAHQLFVVERLGHLLGAALVDAELHEGDRRRATELDRVNEELARTVAALRHRELVQNAFTQIGATGDAADVAIALSRLTGRKVVVRDGFGHVTTESDADGESAAPWLGVEQHRLRRTLRRGGTLVADIGGGRIDGGTIELDIPAGDEKEEDARFALQTAGNALGLLKAQEATVAEMEDRLSRDLVEDLLEGVALHTVAARAAAQGHDLRVPHDVILVAWSSGRTGDTWSRDVQLTRRAMASQDLPCFVAHKHGLVVVVAQHGADVQKLYQDLSREFGPSEGLVAVGEPAAAPEEIPLAYDQARRALTARQYSSTPHGAVAYADLGVERILAVEGNGKEVERLIDDWLGRLLSYDSTHQAELVPTLAAYLDRGGRYDDTAQALSIHRNTLRYRLTRITEISGHDLTDVETKLNLHLSTRAWRLRGAPRGTNPDV